MARNEYAHLRLTMWALWCARNRGGGQIVSAGLAERVDGAGWDAPTVIRNIDAEAEETDRAVQSLDSAAREVVEVFYQGAGDAQKKARRLGVAPATLYLRVERATHAVARWLEERQRAAQLERERVEALQRSAADKAPARSVPMAEPAVDRTGSTLAAHLAASRAARKVAG